MLKKISLTRVSFQWLRRRIYILLHNYFPSSPSKYIKLSKEFTWSACEGGQEVLGPSSGSSPLWVRQTKDGWSFRDRVLCGYCATIRASHSAALLSVCKDVLPHIHRARTRRRALADISTPQPPLLAFDATCSSASTWYQAQDEIFSNRPCLKSLPVQHQIVALLREELGPVTNDGDAVLCLG